ncbi:MAG: histidine phosphatase family protein [Paenibacillus sp.]|uniref:histidine phosphatase family protein n=1 Tax=Paenibacillus sp. TaxID=58172 RepID=UPI0025CE3B1C|nr:histidine phosphatase family protein [Paenibacillus sp.]MBR2567003.1 histidine phosphatase family protein [Paenibacillus sp.]
MAIKPGQEQRELQQSPSVESRCVQSRSQESGSQPSGSHHSIVLIRHGTTQWNVEKKYLGHTDIGLLPAAQEELASLREQCLHLTWDAVYCSDLLRCRQTLAQIAPLATEQAKFDPRLRENDFGQWEGMTYEQLKHNPLYRSWIDDPQEITPPQGEAWQTFTRRIDSFLHEHIWLEEQRNPQKPSYKTLVVTHGGVIRYMVSRLIQGIGFWDTHVIPGQAIQVQIEKQGHHWLGRRSDFPSIGL